MRCHKRRPESAEVEAHGQQCSLLTPRGRLISDNAMEGADGQEIKQNHKVAEAAAAQKRNEKRLRTRVSIFRPP